MSKVKIVTSIDEGLYSAAKVRASLDGVNVINGIIEDALRLYFSFDSVHVWEKELDVSCFQAYCDQRWRAKMTAKNAPWEHIYVFFLRV